MTASPKGRLLFAWGAILSVLLSLVPFGGISASHATTGTYLPFTTQVDEGGSVRTSLTTMVSYPTSGELFFRLSFDTREAQVVGYNRQMATPNPIVALTVPSAVTFTADYLQTLTGTGKTSADLAGFAGTYSVTSIAPSAFLIFQTSAESAERRVLIDQLVLPSSLKVIGATAFTGQCALSTIVVPDLVTDIGANAFSSMTKNYANNPSCTSKTGLTSLTLGAKVERVGTNAFSALNELTALFFRGPRFPDRGTDNSTILPVGYETWGTSPAALLGGMELNNSCQTRFTYVYGLTLSVIASDSIDWTAWATTGNCFAANNITVTTFVPAIADAPVASNASYTTVSLAFTPPTYTGGSAITEYEVEANSGGARYQIVQNLSSPTVIAGLTPNTTYSFKIRARNSAGFTEFSTASNSVTTLAATVPADPVAPVASAPGLNSAVVSFSAPFDGGLTIVEYEVTASPGGQVTLVAATPGSPATISQLSSSTAYSFTVRARNSLGWSNASPASNTVTTLTPAPPQPAPQNPAPPSPTPVTPTPEVTASPSPTPETPTPKPLPLSKSVASVYFNGDSAVLTLKTMASLKAIAARYTGKARVVEVHGYVQRTAETRYDKSLSAQRANAVVEYLKNLKLTAIYRPIAKGISPDPSRWARKAVLNITFDK